MKIGKIRAVWTGTACAILLLGPILAAADAEPAAGGNGLTRGPQAADMVALPSLAPLAVHVLPAVVNISVELNQQAALKDLGSDQSQDNSAGNNIPFPQFGPTPFDQFLHRFFEQPFPQPQPGRETIALGSGFIIDPRGYVVTNNHVVANAEKVTVILQDQSRYPAKVVGRDTRTDLALLKINADKPLPYVGWGDSSKVQVGDWVVAVGNPFGLGGTVTAGIVSAIGRNINEGPYDDFLQIDAPINRGNSGGPTFDLAGRVIGINTAIYSPSGGSVGIGFAIPSNLAKYVIGELEAHGKVTWGWLGVSIQNLTPTIAKSLGLNPNHPEGALVASVISGSPADKAGIKPGDVVVAAGDHPIHDAHDLPRIVAETPIGTRLAITVERDGKQRQLAAEIAPMPAKYAAAEPNQGGAGAPASALGMQLEPLTPELRRQLKIGANVNGVVVAQIAPDSPVAAMGVEAGDVIQSIDQKPATTPQAAAAALTAAARRGNILLLIDRGGTSMFVGLSINNGGSHGTG
jgi:serine protease Do